MQNVKKRRCKPGKTRCDERPDFEPLVGRSVITMVCLLATLGCHAEVLSQEPVVLSYTSSYDMATTIANLERAIRGNNFRVIREQTVGYGFSDSPSEKQIVLYFCNFHLLHAALQRDKDIGFMLPCRITVTEADGKVTIWARNPKYIGALTERATLRKLCDKVKRAYVAIIEEATL